MNTAVIHYLAHLQCYAHPDVTFAQYVGLIDMLEFCARLHQLRWFVEDGDLTGFVGWLRCEPWHLDVLRARSIEQLHTLEREELCTGPVLYVTEMTAPADLSGFTIIRQLLHHTGCQWLAGWRGERFRLHRVTRLSACAAQTGKEELWDSAPAKAQLAAAPSSTSTPSMNS